jgi:hypothetical protein
LKTLVRAANACHRLSVPTFRFGLELLLLLLLLLTTTSAGMLLLLSISCFRRELSAKLELLGSGAGGSTVFMLSAGRTRMLRSFHSKLTVL